MREGRLEAVFGNVRAVALSDAFVHTVVDPDTTDETTNQVTGAGNEVKETGLDRTGKVEARVEDGSDRSQKGILVPDKASGSQAHAEDICVFEAKDNDTDGRDAIPHLLGLLGKAETDKLTARLVGDGFRKESDD